MYIAKRASENRRIKSISRRGKKNHTVIAQLFRHRLGRQRRRPRFSHIT